MRAAAVAVGITVALGGCSDLLSQESPEVSETPEVVTVSPETIELADRAVAEERYSDAETLLERVLLVDPTNVRAKLTLAELHLAIGNRARAMAAFDELTEDPEVSARAHQGMGIAMLLGGTPKPGIVHLDRAVESDPTLWRAWNALGSYYDSQADWEAAAKAYRVALAEHPDEAMIHNNLGFSLFMQGRSDEAIARLERALQLDPELEPAQVNLRLALAWSGRYVHAMTGTSEKDMARVLNNIGYIALLRGDLENAEAYLLRAMEVDPSFNEIAWRNLAHLRNVKELKTVAATEE